MIQNILLVEDDNNIREFVQQALLEVGFKVTSTPDGAQALKIIKEGNVDLVVLDLGIENISGETVCIEAKKTSPDLPIIILTAVGQTTCNRCSMRGPHSLESLIFL